MPKVTSNPLYSAPAKTAVVTTKPKVAAVKVKPLTVRQQAIQQVNAVNAASMAPVNQAAAKAVADSKAQAQQALGFQHALADINQGDAGRIYDAYANAADKVSAYGNLALASTGDSSRSAAEQAQNYLGSVGPDVGAETRPDISGALRALGATSVGDVAGSLQSQGAYAQERQQSVRDAQLMRLADIGAQARYQGTQTAAQLRSDEIARESGSREADVNAAITAIRGEGRAQKAETRAQGAERRAQGEYVRAGTLATNTEKRAAAEEARSKAAEIRAADDQRMKDRAFDIEIQQQRVDLAAKKLANATGEIARKQAQFELDHSQQVLDGTLKAQAADIAATRAGTKKTAAETAATKTGKKGGITVYQHRQAVKQAYDAAETMHDPPAPTSLAEKPKQRVNYQDAIPRLMGKYGLTKAEAVDVLDTYYKQPGVDGRPAFDFRERAQLVKLGFTNSQIQQAMNAYTKAARGQKFHPGGKALYEKMLDRLAGKPVTRTAAATRAPEAGTPPGPYGPYGSTG